MRILVDGSNLSLKTGTGVATYARNVCQVARQSGHSVDVLYGEPFSKNRRDVLHEIGFFDVEKQRKRLGPAAWAARQMSLAAYNSFPVRPFEVPLSGAVITRQFSSRMPEVDRLWNVNDLFYDNHFAYRHPLRLSKGFTRVSNTFGADIAHWTYPLPMRLDGAKNIYTLHDLVPLRLPYTSLDSKRVYYRMIDRICRDADLIVTVSETSRDDIVSLFDVPAEKVVNTYQSVDFPQKMLDLDRATLEEELRGLHDVSYKNYILFFGAIEPKKNVGRLIEAYLSSSIDMPLLVVGKDGWLFENELALLKNPVTGAASEQPRVRRINYVSFAQLVNLIRGARFVTLPSLYEGFGLPILEAMTCDTPVLTSNFGAMSEIAGDAGLLVDPYDVRDIRAGLNALSRNDDLAADLVDKGRKRVEAFSAENYARRLSAVYGRVAGPAV